MKKMIKIKMSKIGRQLNTIEAMIKNKMQKIDINHNQDKFKNQKKRNNEVLKAIKITQINKKILKTKKNQYNKIKKIKK